MLSSHIVAFEPKNVKGLLHVLYKGDALIFVLGERKGSSGLIKKALVYLGVSDNNGISS